MKITKTAYREAFLKNAKKSANKGCNKCPCCEEPYKMPSLVSRTWYDSGGLFGLGKGKHMKVDCYSCSWCGAEWESDPYEWV